MPIILVQVSPECEGQSSSYWRAPPMTAAAMPGWRCGRGGGVSAQRVLPHPKRERRSTLSGSAFRGAPFAGPVRIAGEGSDLTRIGAANQDDEAQRSGKPSAGPARTRSRAKLPRDDQALLGGRLA